MTKGGSKERAFTLEGRKDRTGGKVEELYMSKSIEVGKLLAEPRAEKAQQSASVPEGEDHTQPHPHGPGGMVPPLYSTAARPPSLSGCPQSIAWDDMDTVFKQSWIQSSARLFSSSISQPV